MEYENREEWYRERSSCWHLSVRFLVLYWRSLAMVLGPLLCLPIFLCDDQPKFRCLYALSVMSIYWITECIPLPVTGLLPLVLLPALGVQPTDQVSVNYFKDANMLFVSSIFVAVSVEHSGLHMRIAMLTITGVGCSPRRLQLAIMLVTMMLSMWIMNAASVAMMCSVIMATLKQMERLGVAAVYEPPDPEDPDGEPRPTSLTQAYYLGTMWAANIGGTGCLVGTATNIVFKELYESRFPDAEDIPFFGFMLLNGPQMLLNTVLAWLWLQFYFMGLLRPDSPDGRLVRNCHENRESVRNTIRTRYKELGPWTCHEITVVVLFVALVILWLLRDPMFMTGWPKYISDVEITNSTPPIFIVALMFMLPTSVSFLYACSKDPLKRPHKQSPAIMTWKALALNMPWGTMLLLGGGIAIADAGQKSGMSLWLGQKMQSLEGLNTYMLLGCVGLITSFVTEIMSNVAICNIVIPILLEMCVQLKIHPISLSYVAMMCSSMCFLLPAGTPANAIVSERVHVQTKSMVASGIVPKLLSWFIATVLFVTYGRLFYDIHEFPEWAVA